MIRPHTPRAQAPMRLSTLPCALAGALALAAPVLAGTDPAPTLSDDAFAITADTVVVEGGTVIADGLVLIDGGRILAVGTEADLRGTLADGVHVHDHEGWLTAGMVAANATWGLARPDDPTRALQPDLVLADGYDAEHRPLTAAAEAGITAYGLTAGRTNVAGGVGGVATTGGELLVEHGHLALCLAPPALRGDRYPTSYGGAVRAVEDGMAAGQGAFGKAAKGELRLEVAVEARHEVRRALDLLARAELPAVLRGAPRAGDFAAELAAAGHGVALAPPTLAAPAWWFASLDALAEAGVPFAFGLADTSATPDALRFGASLLVAHGMDHGAAWNALTVHPAAQLGVADQLGRVAGGQRADLCLWSGDPLDLTTDLEAVFLGGERVGTDEGDQE